LFEWKLCYLSDIFYPHGIVPKLCPSRSNISKQFQTKPKVSWKIGIELTACNYSIFRFSKVWSENPRVGSSILSLGTRNWKASERFLWGFFNYSQKRGIQAPIAPHFLRQFPSHTELPGFHSIFFLFPHDK
jgi:hypothetical protein